MDTTRLWPYDLRSGSSSDPREGACTMDAVSWFAYGHLGDHPECACPVLTSYVTVGQDAMPHNVRQRLKPFIFRLIGSRDPTAESSRARILTLAAACRFAPLLLEAGGCRAAAATLRGLLDNVSFTRIRSAMVAAEAGSSLLAAQLKAERAAGEAARVAAEAASEDELNVEVWAEYLAALDAALNAGKQGDFDLDLAPARLAEFAAAREC